MTFYEQELKKLFGNSDVIRDAKYSGKTLLGRIDDELRVKLQFVYTGTRDHYNALRLKIINRTDGEVDAETFKFSDILGGNPAYQNNPFAKEIHVWENNGKADWYGYRPSPAAYQKIADTVNDYISMYQEEDMEIYSPASAMPLEIPLSISAHRLPTPSLTPSSNGSMRSSTAPSLTSLP